MMLSTGAAPAVCAAATATAAVLTLVTTPAALAETPARQQIRQEAPLRAVDSSGAVRQLAGWQSPDAIRGLKWRGAQRSRQRADALGVKFDTRGLSYQTAVGSLANNGFQTVVLRVANMTDLPPRTTTKQRDDEVIGLLRQLNARGIRVYLWKRQWFQRSHRILSWKHRGTEAGADQFIADMSALIKRAERERIAGTLQGVIPIETNLNNTSELRERALYVATRLNARTGGWLKNHTLMMPGAGMGEYFKGIDRGGARWLTRMKQQTRHFAFVYKHMRSQEGGVCDLQRWNKQWDYYVGYKATTGVDKQIQWLRGTMGVRDLENYLHRYRVRYPRHTHVVFWGDLSDGIFAMSALDGQPQRNYNTVRALHKLLVRTNHWHGYFFDFPFTNKRSTTTDLWGYLITVDQRNGYQRARNRNLNRSRTHNIWNEWHMWGRENARY